MSLAGAGPRKKLKRVKKAFNRKNTQKAADVLKIAAAASGNPKAILAAQALDDVQRIIQGRGVNLAGTGPKKKLRAVKKAFNRKNTQKATDVLKIAAAASGNPKAIAAAQALDDVQRTIQGRGRKTRLEKAMCP